MILLYLSLILIAGLYLGSFFSLSLYSLIPGLLILLVIPLLRRYMRPLLLGALCLLAFSGGNLLYQLSLPESGADQLPFYNDKGTVVIEGFIQDDPQLKDNAAILQVKANTVYLNGRPQDISGKVLIRTSRLADYRYGDILYITGNLQTPGTFDNFDYGRYLAARDIYSIMYYPAIKVMGTGEGSTILSAIYGVRTRFSDVLARSLPEPQGALAQAILLGKRDSVPDSLMQTFSRTGTAHLLAISGLHLSIIIGMLMSLGAAAFGRRYSIHILLSLLILWLYVIFTGMRPPVMRGAIMGTMYLIGQSLGRQRSGTTALCFAAAVMIGLEPLILWDASFQLSFLAMAGLIFIAAPLRALSRNYLGVENDITTPIRKIGTFTADTIAVTISAILATWPVIAYHFGLISFTGLPATFFALPSLPFIIVLSILVCIAGLIVPLAGQLLAWLAWLFISYLLFIISAYDSLPFSSIQTGSIPVWSICCYYALLAAVFLFLKYRATIIRIFSRFKIILLFQWQRMEALNSRRQLRWIFLPLLLITVIVWGAVLAGPDKKLHLTILDIGQGDAILVQTPGGQNILIDGGPSPSAINIELGKKLPFYNKRIDMVVVTQPHADHLTGLVEVLDHYIVKQVVQPKISATSSLFNRWSALLDRRNIPVTVVQAGQRIEPGSGIMIDILNPPEQPLTETENDVDNNGLVLKLHYNKVSFLLTADIYHEAEWNLISRGIPLRSTVLKVPHHGSRTSSSIEFLKAVSPAAAVISAGSDNRFGHPHSEVMNRLTECLEKDSIYITAESGTVEFISDGERLWVKKGR